MGAVTFNGSQSVSGGTSFSILNTQFRSGGAVANVDTAPGRMTSFQSDNGVAGGSSLRQGANFNTFSDLYGQSWITGVTASGALSNGTMQEVFSGSGFFLPTALTWANVGAATSQNFIREAAKHLLSGSDSFTISGTVSALWGDYDVVPANAPAKLGDDIFFLGAPFAPALTLATGFSSIIIYGDARVVSGGSVTAGSDIISGSNAGVALTIYGDFQAVTGGVVVYGNDTIFGGFQADTIYGDSTTMGGAGGNDVIHGGGGADSIYGGGGYDILSGGADADLLDGGEGFDYAAYFSFGVTADLMTPALNTGEALGDVYVSIEGLAGGSYVDTLGGDNNVNWIYGNEGNDTIYGRDGNDYLLGGEGGDFIYGDGGSDSIYGGYGTDYLFGGAGADYLYGEQDFDYAAYTYSSGAVTVDLVSNVVNTGEAAGDQLNGIEGIIGSNFNDSLRGDNNTNWLMGGGGNDTIYARGGDDFIEGGTGNDYLSGEAGNDTFVFRPSFGLDNIFDFTAGNGAADVLNILLGAAYDSYSEVMAVTTQAGANSVITIDANNTITLLNVNRANLVADDFRFV